MKISNTTLNILRNFSTINQNILFKPGNRIKTMNLIGNIYADCVVEETFPIEFGIYDLNQFLGGLTIFEDPDLVFNNDKYLTISEKNAKTKYFFSDPRMIVSPPDKELYMPSEDVEFTLTTHYLETIKKVSTIYNLPDLSIVGDGSVIKMLLHNKKDTSSNEFSLEVGSTDQEFTFNFKMENLVFMRHSYRMILSKALIAKLECMNLNLVYWISPEPDSQV